MLIREILYNIGPQNEDNETAQTTEPTFTPYGLLQSSQNQVKTPKKPRNQKVWGGKKFVTLSNYWPFQFNITIPYLKVHTNGQLKNDS